MFNYSRFEVFLDCLWGLTVLVALYLLQFGFFATEDLRAVVGTGAPWFQGAILVTFVYIYSLRLRRHIMRYFRTGN